MGMYDEIRFDPAVAPLCSAGHPITYFQTKDLTCSMGIHFITEDWEVFKLQTSGWVATESDKVFGRYDSFKLSADRKEMLLTSLNTAVFNPGLNATARIYNGCGKCKPVLVATTEPSAYRGDLIEERGNNFEYRLEIIEGYVKTVTPVVCPTRDALRARLEKQGAIVLEDEHPIAAAHFYRKEQEKG